MHVFFYKLYKIDIINNKTSLENFSNKTSVNNYITELLQDIIKDKGDKEYIFDETLSTSKNHIQNLTKIDSSNVNAIEFECKKIADRLLSVEVDAQKNVRKLGIDIQKGLLVIAFVEKSKRLDKVIISKADYAEFIEETSGSKTTGLPIKKKIFKSFSAEVKKNKTHLEFGKITTFDVNITTSVYWWKTFLELKELRDDTTNTKNAFNSINVKVLSPLKKDHKSDYLHLWNATVAYFRSSGNFDIKYYAENIIGSYTPFDVSLNMEKEKNKIIDLPRKCKFDNKFKKEPTAVKNRYKNEVRLTDEIDLVIKQDIPNLNQTIRPHEEDGKKYIMVMSNDGYEYAKGLNIENS